MAMEEVGGNMINAVIVVYLNRHEVEFNWSYMKMGRSSASGSVLGRGAVLGRFILLTFFRPSVERERGIKEVVYA